MGSNERDAKPPVQVVICIEEGKPHQLLSGLLLETLLEDERYVEDQIHILSPADPDKVEKRVSDLAKAGAPVVLVVSPQRIRGMGADMFRRRINQLAGEVQLVAFSTEDYWTEDPRAKRVNSLTKDWMPKIKAIVDGFGDEVVGND